MVFVIFYVGVFSIFVLSIFFVLDNLFGDMDYSNLWVIIPLLWLISAGIGKYIGI